MSLPAISGLTKSIYGTNASNAVSYNIASVGSTDLMRENKLTAIAQKACDERVRRGSTTITIPSGYYSGQIIASRVQDIRTVVEVAGPAATQAYMGQWRDISSSNGTYATGGTVPTYNPVYGAPTGYAAEYATLPPPDAIDYAQAPAPVGTVSFSKNQRISAVDINAVITEINNAGAVCTCNCNYCTCNCNYCTCNCNYSCTCNCNYSDEQLKANVEYL